MSKEDDDALCAAQNRHMEHPLRTDRITLVVNHRGKELKFWRHLLGQAFDQCEGVHLAEGMAERVINGQTIGAWIPVSERLPEKDTAVLVHTDMDGTHAASFDGEEWFCDYGGAWLFPNVTHWMPLPEPPEVK